LDTEAANTKDGNAKKLHKVSEKIHSKLNGFFSCKCKFNFNMWFGSSSFDFSQHGMKVLG